jgi:hypothetical protein
MHQSYVNANPLHPVLPSTHATKLEPWIRVTISTSMLIRGIEGTYTAINFPAAVRLSNRATTGITENYAYQPSIIFGNTAYYSSSYSTVKKKVNTTSFSITTHFITSRGIYSTLLNINLHFTETILPRQHDIPNLATVCFFTTIYPSILTLV